MFRPLAFTKTFAMVSSTILAVTLVPVLCTFLIRGKLHREENNPVMRILQAIYRPVLRTALRFRVATLGVAFHGLFLVANLDTRVSRIGGRRGDASDADAATARAQESYELGALAWTRIDASGSLEETLSRARAALRT